jgi:hypothetical protein
MPTIDKTAKPPPSRAKEADDVVRVREVERDPGSILRRAAEQPVRVTAKGGTRMFHIVTIRCGDRDDPAWSGSLPVTIVALKRRAGRILHLASGLQIALRVQVTARSPDVFFIEPGRECLEFATQRMGGSSSDAALLKTAIRRSRIVRAATETAVKQADARWQDEVKSLQERIATLERAAKKHAGLAEALKQNETALQEARKSERTAQAAAKKITSDRDAEVLSLKSRIAALERTAKNQTALRERSRIAMSPKHQPEPETSPSGTSAGGSPGPHQL